MKSPVGIGAIGLGGEINETCLRRRLMERLIQRVEVRVFEELHVRPVVETGSAHGAIVHPKAGDADDVQRNVSSSAESGDVTGVRWNLWFDERDRQHEQ